MADSKISALTALAEAPAAGDLLVLVDVSDTTMAASGTDKKITYANLTSALTSGATTFATSSAQTFTNGITTSGNVGILNTSPGTIGALNVSQENGEFAAIFGSDANAVTLTNATRKVARIGFPHITNAEEPVTFCFLDSDTGINNIYIGGATGVGNAATTISFYTAANATTLTGSERARITSAGYFGIGVTVPTALLHVAASSTTRASACVVAGTAPTTPVAGDIWNDGALSFYNADATTNAIVNHLRLSRDSTGTAAAGLGLGILAELESTTTSRQSAGRLTWEWATATHASRAAKGKLTAYYTSTEREAITWVADSAGVKVGIGESSPTLKLHVSESNVNATGVRITNTESSGELSLYSAGNAAFGIASWVDAAVVESGTGHATGLVLSAYDGMMAFQTSARTTRMTLTETNGYLGLGTTSPQGLLHGHDGSGGFLFVNRASVGGTLVTVIPDAAGDVTEKIFFVGWCTNSSPFSADVAPTTLTVSSSTTKTDGVNTLTIAVTAGGAFTLQATAGAATWNVNLWVFWR